MQVGVSTADAEETAAGVLAKVTIYAERCYFQSIVRRGKSSGTYFLRTFDMPFMLTVIAVRRPFGRQTTSIRDMGNR
ncbi:MAG: hypothetical protein ACI8P3_003438 [Saprospiraceae bacterium]|jgi:hypothetical protein